MTPLKCARCGFHGYVSQDFGHTCMTMISLDEYERMNARFDRLSLASLEFLSAIKPVLPQEFQAQIASDLAALKASMDMERQPQATNT